MDARVKIVVLLAFSIAIFFARTGVALAVFAALALAAILVARIPPATVNRLLVPVYVLAGFSALFNFAASPTIEGALVGIFFAVRMIALVAMSYVVCLTSTSQELLDAFTSFIEPLRPLKEPVDDIAFTLALSIRLIPVIQEELDRIRTAQKARGAESAGSFMRKLNIWGNAFAALFVGLFRHADSLAQAMDARCYGAATRRTKLPKSSDSTK